MLINKIDSRVKLLLVLLFTVLIFFVDKLSIAVVMAFSFLMLRLVFKVRFNGVKSFIFLAILVMFIIFTQSLFLPGKNTLSFPLFGGVIPLKPEGFFMGLTIGCRLFALILLLPFLTSTTSPYSLACGLAALGINYRAAFIITTAFNLIPLFQEEGRAIMDAQKLRGMNVFEKSLKKRASFLSRLKSYPSLVTPLVLGAMRKAQIASVSMDSRAFGVYPKRTWLEKPAMKVHDYICMAVCLVFAGVILSLNILL
jgi:energy-coupling factor transport system permease protein